MSFYLWATIDCLGLAKDGKWHYVFFPRPQRRATASGVELQFCNLLILARRSTIRATQGLGYHYTVSKTFQQSKFDKPDTKPNLSLYSAYYAEACNEFAVPNSASQSQDNTATCVYVEAVANLCNAV